MGNKAKGVVTKTIGGKSVSFCLDFNAICEIEDLRGEDFTTTVGEFQTAALAERVNFRVVRTILWASMLKANPDATLADAGNVAQALGEGAFALMQDILATSGLFDAAGDADAVGNAPDPSTLADGP